MKIKKLTVVLVSEENMKSITRGALTFAVIPCAAYTPDTELLKCGDRCLLAVEITNPVFIAFGPDEEAGIYSVDGKLVEAYHEFTAGETFRISGPDRMVVSLTHIEC